jgi:hypothetical protein
MAKEDELGTGYIQLARDLSPIEAQVLLGRLHADGVEAHLIGENHALANPLLLNALGGVRLFVREGQQQLALEVMAATEQGEYVIGEELLADEPRGVLDGSSSEEDTQVSGPSAKKLFVLVALLILAILLAVESLDTVWAQSYDYFPYSMTPEPASRILGKWVLSALLVSHPVVWIFFIAKEVRKK